MFRDRRRQAITAAVLRGRQLVIAGEDRETFEFLEDAVERFPDDPELRVLLASVSLELQPNEVASQAAKAADLGVDDPAIQVRAGHLLLGAGELMAAEACSRRARELAGFGFPLMAGLETLEARFLINRDRQADALSVINEALVRVKEKDDLERMRRELAG